MSVVFEQGLRDVPAAESALCEVDGTAGRLRYRGYDIGDLARNAVFEEVIALLWDGELPDADALGSWREKLAQARPLPAEITAAMAGYPRAVHPLEAVRTAISHLAMIDHAAGREHRVRAVCERITARMGTVVAAWARIRAGESSVEPDDTLGTAAGFLFMLHGRPPAPEAVRAMDALLVLHAEHEMNASTFAARVVAATFADPYSAVTAALSALKGPRHGGANEDVLAMLEAIGRPERADEYIAARLAARERMTRAERAEPRNRIPGWGHPVYKVDDPRAAHLRALGASVAGRPEIRVLAETAEAVYRAMKARSDLPVNVDFFSAVTYRALVIPIDLCTSIFAVARAAGWCAHVQEQYGGRLLRPRALYTGPPTRPFVPLAERRPGVGAA